MTTTEAIKFCFTSDVYEAARKRNSPPEMLKMACLIAFRTYLDAWPRTSQHYQVAQQLRKALTTLEETGMMGE